jgi:cell division protein ZipA
MDFGLRDWLFILGPVFIIGVLVHGYWRMRINRHSLKMSLDKSFLNSQHDSRDGAAEVEKLRSELPNGGARVISEPMKVSLNLDDDVPVLMEPVGPVDPPLGSDAATDELMSESMDDAVPAEPSDIVAGPITAAVTVAADSSPEMTSRGELENASETPSPEAPSPEAPSPETRNPPEVVAAAVEPLRAVAGCPEKYLVLYVVARNKEFRIETLFTCLKKHQMLFGEMSIFHRLDADNRSEFSLVNAIEPGTFDPDTMGSMSTPALSLFMRAHELADPIATYHEMLMVAEALGKALNGEVRDESRNPLSRQTMEHYQADLQAFVDSYFR